MAIGDIYQLNILQRLETQTVENVLHYQVTADADRTVLQDALHLYASNNWGALAILVQSIDITYTMSRVQKIWPLPITVFSEQPMFLNGTVETQALPAEVAGVVTKQSFLAGRAFRGRSYIAGIPNDRVLRNIGLFDDDTVAALNTLGLSMSANVYGTPTGAFKPVIYHRATHTTTDIATCIGRNTPRMQRRRQIGRGI